MLASEFQTSSRFFILSHEISRALASEGLGSPEGSHRTALKR